MPRRSGSKGLNRSNRSEKPRVVKAGTSPRGTSFGKGQKIVKNKGQ